MKQCKKPLAKIKEKLCTQRLLKCQNKNRPVRELCRLDVTFLIIKLRLKAKKNGFFYYNKFWVIILKDLHLL
jgi:hypothetical protein